MRMFMTFACMPFTTVILGTLINDFHISIIAIILMTFASYMFWDKFFEQKKTESNSNC